MAGADRGGCQGLGRGGGLLSYGRELHFPGVNYTWMGGGAVCAVFRTAGGGGAMDGGMGPRGAVGSCRKLSGAG